MLPKTKGLDISTQMVDYKNVYETTSPKSDTTPTPSETPNTTPVNPSKTTSTTTSKTANTSSDTSSVLGNVFRVLGTLGIVGFVIYQRRKYSN